MSLIDREIRPLGDALVNQIAAGEVIERPASALKELIENSLDAGATEIDIDIDAGGIERIQVRDNGRGIRRNELALALARHCTSKIAAAEDLEAIISLGFRGEALASLCAVAEMTLTSRHRTDEQAWCVSAAPGGVVSAPEPRPHPVGTTVCVGRLFATIPGRRRFLKRPQTELLHLQQLVKRLAFCHAQLAITLNVDGRRVARYAAACDELAAARRWRAVFGPEFQQAARPVETAVDRVRISGWVGGPELASNQIELQYLAVNGRAIRDRQLGHAIRLAYDTLLPPGKYAVYALHLQVPADALDANVHPAKTEVRFHYLREVHDALFSTVRHALDRPSHPDPVAPSYELSRPPRREILAAEVATSPPSAPDAGIAAPALVSLLGRRFAVVAHRRQQALLDLRGVLMALLARRLAAQGATGPVATRPVLFPQTLRSEALAADEGLRTALARHGIELSPMGPASFALRSLPIIMPDVDVGEFAAALAAAGTGEPIPLLCAAAGAAFRVPEGAAERRQWFERTLSAAVECGVRLADHLRDFDEATIAQWFDDQGPRRP